MSESEHIQNEIKIGFHNDEIYLEAAGHITAKHSFTVREFIFSTVSKTDKPTTIFFDLSKTEYMDSTFLGLLILIDKKFSKNSNIELTVINPSSNASILLTRAHIINFLNIEKKDLPSEMLLENLDDTVDLSDYERLKFLYEAHQELSLVDEKKKGYEDLKKFLKEEIDDKE